MARRFFTSPPARPGSGGADTQVIPAGQTAWVTAVIAEVPSGVTLEGRAILRHGTADTDTRLGPEFGSGTTQGEFELGALPQGGFIVRDGLFLEKTQAATGGTVVWNIYYEAVDNV